MRKIFLLLCALVWGTFIYAQTAPPGELSGLELRNWYKTNWYNGKYRQLTYDGARRAMYSTVDEEDDGQVYCVYTGFNQKSASVTFLNPINAEHTVPQSWYNQDLPMRSDIFHIYPTHQSVNSARGAKPFDEIPDSQTDTWFIGNESDIQTSGSIPSSNIDDYSENDEGRFEPREDHKGDLARAIFYFFTMYDISSYAGSPTISDIVQGADLEQLYEWHIDDPVDDWERQRNDRVEVAQGNRNPYIDYPQTVCRAWGYTCENIPTISFALGEDEISSDKTNYQVVVESSEPLSEDMQVKFRLVSTKNILPGVGGFSVSPELIGGVATIDFKSGEQTAPIDFVFSEQSMANNSEKKIVMALIPSGTFNLGQMSQFDLTISQQTVTSLRGQLKRDIIMYPNPTTGLLNFEGAINNKHIEILNVHGGIVLKGNLESPLDLTHLSRGIYFIRIGKSLYYQKLFLE